MLNVRNPATFDNRHQQYGASTPKLPNFGDLTTTSWLKLDYLRCNISY